MLQKEVNPIYNPSDPTRTREKEEDKWPVTAQSSKTSPGLSTHMVSFMLMAQRPPAPGLLEKLTLETLSTTMGPFPIDSLCYLILFFPQKLRTS